MNLNVYLEDSLAKSLNNCAKKYHKSRNLIIREALRAWIEQQQHQQWQDSILNFKGISHVEAFESFRDDLLPPDEDLFK